MRLALTIPILFILSFLSLSLAEVQNYTPHYNNSKIANNIHKLKTLGSLIKFFHEIEKVVLKIFHTRQIVPKSSGEQIRVMDLFNTINTGKVCNRCQNLVERIRRFDETERIRKIAEGGATLICRLHWKKAFCKDIIRTFGDIYYDNLIDRALNPHVVCQRYRLCPRTIHKASVKEYVKEVMKDKPERKIPVPGKTETYKILHLTDPHIDLKYEIGANAFCGDPFCCRVENGFPRDPNNVAQYWGTLAPCDMPMRTFDQFLQWTSQNLEIDMIIWTGDNIAHDIWRQSQENQTQATLDVTLAMKKYFPNTAIYPMFGNHEPYPADQFDLFGNKSDWLLESLSGMWKDWLGPETTAHFRKHSYYSKVDERYNVKIIVLDTQVCDAFNFYLIRDPTDPLKHLEWLRKELYESEAKDQGVIIMGHIPPGDFFCDSEWSARYRALADRFSNIIRGQFFGHSHMDQLQVVRSWSDSSPVGVIHISPSFSTYSYIHPSFRVFEMDAKTNQPIDYYQYRLDLNKWNKNTSGPIEFDLAYSFLKEYDLPDMSFESHDMLATRLRSDKNFALKYAFNMEAGAKHVGKLAKREIEHFYCLARNSVAADALRCLGLNASVLDLLAFAIQLMPGAWHFDKC